MWQLIRYEIGKLLGKKIVWACLLGMAVMECVMISWWIYPGVEGVQYFRDGALVTLEGSEGIRENQAISEKYAGILTDEKVQEFLAEFDMPDEDMANHGMDPAGESFYLHNSLYSYLRGSFMQADGSWNGRTVEEVYGDLAGQIRLGYHSGWGYAIGAIMDTLMSMGCVLVVLLAPLFAKEYAKGMDALILTGANGKTKCAWAKILAGFLVSMALVGMVIVTMMSVYLATHGTVGWEATMRNLQVNVPYAMSSGQGLLFALLLWVTAGLVLSAVSILISAAAKNSFSSLVISFAVFVIPLLIPWSRLGFLYFPAQFFPALQMRLWNMYELLPIQAGSLQLKVMWLTIPIALVVTIFCSIFARRTFARHQVMG